MAGKKLFCIALLFLAFLTSPSSRAAGVTIITHGYGGDVTGWITAMANHIPAYFHARYPGLSTNITIYTVSLTTDGANYFYQWTRNSGPAPSNSDTGEIIIKLDWSQMAGGTAPYNITTSNVAAVASTVLLQTNAIADLGGHALAEYPIHLIGHSRGASLITQLSYLLGTNGVWVDHLTTIDPHPLNNDGDNDTIITSVVDAPANRTYANVLYADNFWENLGRAIPQDLDPHGESVAGAYHRQLTSLNGGYPPAPFDFSDAYEFHSNTHFWYYATIDLNTPTSYNDDGTTVSLDATMRANWWVPYESQGLTAGFYYSLIGGGNRLSGDHPLGLPSNPAIVDGFNQWWNLGAGTSSNRTALPANNGTWPNLMQFSVLGTNTVTAGQTIGVSFYYQYGGASTNLTAQFYFAGDFNAFGTNRVLTAQLSLLNTGVNSVYSTAANLTTAHLSAGTYAVYAKISDGSHSRYLYAPQLIQVLAPPAPAVGIGKLSSTQVLISISGATGQKVVLQSSPDFQNWQPLATNLNSSGQWFYPAPISPVSPREYYRAVASP